MSSHGELPAAGAETTGEIVGIGLTDVIQIHSHNRFSGCIGVESARGTGHLFFRDGEVVHAEQGGRSGEEAFCDILEWPPGRYRLQPNVATTRATIQKSSQHLLLDAHRLLDERRAGRPAAAPTPVAPASAPGPATRTRETLDRIRKLPGVSYAAVLTKEGAPAGDASYEGELLGGQAIYLSILGNQLGTLFQTGAILSAAVHGAGKHLLLFATKSHFLGVLVAAESQLGAVEAGVRRILTAPR